MKHLKEDDHIILDQETPHADHHADHVHPEESKREYTKFALVLLAILVVSIGITTLRGWGGNRFANDFMATFFITFAAFKFINIEVFAITYRTYDKIAQNFRPWAYMFPFIEAFLGLAYFISTDAWQVNLLTMIITGTAGYSVFLALKRKSKFHCACLGTFIKLPLTKVSFVENFAMFIMATIMLVA